jgi:hypothetical protein
VIDNLVMVAFGVWITLAGFNRIKLSRDSDKNEAFLKNYGVAFRIGGITLVVIGLVLAFVNSM